MNERLETAFSHRLCQLSTGQTGLRTGLVCDIRTPNDADGLPLLDFIASDETVDRYNEVIKASGWVLSNYLRNPVVVDSHDYSSVSKILGKSVHVAISGGRLINRVQFAVDNPMGKIAYHMAMAGCISAESVGFVPIDWKAGDESKGQPSRTFTKQELVEISLVAVPANPGAVTDAIIGFKARTRCSTRAATRWVQDHIDIASDALCAPPTHPTDDRLSSGLKELLEACR